MVDVVFWVEHFYSLLGMELSAKKRVLGALHACNEREVGIIGGVTD